MRKALRLPKSPGLGSSDPSFFSPSVCWPRASMDWPQEYHFITKHSRTLEYLERPPWRRLSRPTPPYFFLRDFPPAFLQLVPIFNRNSILRPFWAPSLTSAICGEPQRLREF